MHSPGVKEINEKHSMSPGELPIQREKQDSKHTTPTEFGQSKEMEIKMAI